MPDDQRPFVIHFFGEDRGHAELVPALLARIGKQEGLRAAIETRSDRGGLPALLSALKAYMLALRKTALRLPDVLAVAADLNCHGQQNRETIEGIVGHNLACHIVLACPNPHVEYWYIADGASFGRVVGARAEDAPWKCERAEYKRRLTDAVARAGHAAPLGGLEFGRDLAVELDPYVVGKADPEFRRFWQNTENALRTLVRIRSVL